MFCLLCMHILRFIIAICEFVALCSAGSVAEPDARIMEADVIAIIEVYVGMQALTHTTRARTRACTEFKPLMHRQEMSNNASKLTPIPPYSTVTELPCSDSLLSICTELSIWRKLHWKEFHTLCLDH